MTRNSAQPLCRLRSPQTFAHDGGPLLQYRALRRQECPKRLAQRRAVGQPWKEIIYFLRSTVTKAMVLTLMLQYDS